MQITHQEARRLIHFHADDALNSHEKSALLTHIAACAECRVYAEEIKEVESNLFTVMKQQWYVRPVPLSINGLRAKRKINLQSGNILTMRTALISFVFVALIFSAWQFIQTSPRSAGESPLIIAPLPTPSVELTSTTIPFDDCYVIRYTVQPDDTLASIAHEFSTSEEEIISMNRLKNQIVHSGLTLMIPACDFTPTVAFQPTLPTTSTPVLGSTTSSPAPNRY